jgi:3-oxoacyl-[acyl-carrier-protein] synthase-3
MPLSSVLIATGSYLPKKILDNAELASMVDTTDAWIRERTGIETRHMLAAGETTADMATEAAKRALAKAGLRAEDIDGIVVGTSTPDTTMPSVATKVQVALGMRGAALDVAAACTGFVYALSVAHGWMQGGLCKRVLVIGAEAMSKIVNWQDRSTCILFGDGAGAAIFEARETRAHEGILAFTLDADGQFGPLLGTDGGVATTQTSGVLTMQGKEVFRHGVEKMAATATECIAKAGLKLSDIRWVIAHQANARMIHMIAKQLGLNEENVVITVNQHGNTSAASIPLALDTAFADGRIQRGDILALPALGAGLTWGCCVVKV